MKIVSANYRDRQSPFKWLIRDEDEPIEAAKACKSVEASGIEFVNSSAGEQGFGCKTVARCEMATGIDFEQVEGKLEFNSFGGTFWDEDGNMVTELAKLRLTEEGEIFGIKNAE